MTEFEAPMEVKKRENVLAGIVGAFLGSLIGVACIVIVGQMGYVASICGLVMAVCSLKGYEMLSGGLGKTGAAVSFVLMLIMTYLANQLEWAITASSALEIGIWEAFRAVPALREAGAIEDRAYWGGLAMLYLFTLVGAVPTVLAGLRGDAAPDLPSVPAGAAAETDIALYPSEKSWTRPLRLSAALSMLVGLVPGLVLLLVWMGKAGGSTSAWPLFASLGCIGSAFVMMFAAFPSLRLCDAEFLLLARSGGTLWRIHLSQLNMMDTYRFTKKNGSLPALRWNRLSPEERERARASVSRAINLLQSGQLMSGSALSRAVFPLTDLQVEGENDWRWKVTYSANKGKRKKASIAKAFPNFAPAPGMEPPTGPVPWRWSLFAAALATALILGAAAAAGGGALMGEHLPGGSHPAQTRVKPEAQAPERTETYTLDGVSFQMDAQCEETNGGREFSDPNRDLRYTVSVQHGQNLEAATSALTGLISENRLKSDFDSFSFTYAYEEDVIIPMTASDGSEYQHGLINVYFTGGNAIERAVALSGDGTLFSVTAHRGKRVDGESVTSALLFILESVRISEEAKAASQLTGENYQSMFHLAEDEGYTLIGKGYILAPEGMFDYAEAFVDAYVPYSEAPEYLDGGRTIRSAAHGMDASVTIARSTENAAAVVDEAFAALTASGVEPYADGTMETQYVEEYDIAFKQVIYFEDGDGAKPRLTVLYADRKQDSYYLSARITYLLEQTDGAYPTLVAELGDVFALTLPELDPFEE